MRTHTSNERPAVSGMKAQNTAARKHQAAKLPRLQYRALRLGPYDKPTYNIYVPYLKLSNIGGVAMLTGLKN